MLRASSLGLRCYLQTSRFSSLQCRRRGGSSSRSFSSSPQPRPQTNAEDEHSPKLSVVGRAVRGESEMEPEDVCQKDRGQSAPQIDEKQVSVREGLDEDVRLVRRVKPLKLERSRRKLEAAKKRPRAAPADSGDLALREFPLPPHLDTSHPAIPSDNVSVDQNADRQSLLDTLATTNSLEDALHAYNILSSRPVPPPELTIPYEHLHRLARLIAKSNPHTRPLFIHFLSVVSTIHRTGGTVKLWEWNALMDFAGKGFRKTRQRDFVAAFNIFCDMISHKPPGASFIQSDIRPVTHPEPIGKSKSGMERVPDIVTFTTLLDIAARSLHEPTLNRALRIFRQSGLTPNRITYLTLMRYYARRPELSGIRACISQLSNQGVELDTPLVNACIWAFARSGHLDVAGAMYVVMQSHPDDPPERLEEASRAREFLESHEGLRIPSKLKPDDVTYTSLLQCYAYHGDLGGALRVFADMIHWMNDTKRELNIKLVLPAFRAIFCGFVRHGQPPSSEDHIYSRYSGNDKNPWTLDALDALFNDFIHLPGTATPSTRMLFWVLEAFNKLCGGDVEKMREVFHRIERRFRRRWTGRLLEIRRELFPDGNHLDDIEDEPEDQGGEAYNEEGYEDEN